MSDPSKKKREISPASEGEEAQLLKKSKESDELDTPTKLMIEQFLAFEKKQPQLVEEAKKDQRVKLTRLYMIEPPQNNTHRKQVEDEEQKMLERIIATQQGSSTLKQVTEDMLSNFNDGRRIFVNRLRFYKESIVEEHMISFKQLCYKDLGFKNKLKGQCEVKVAILSTMVFDIDVLKPMLEARVPLTVFLERSSDQQGPQVEYSTKLNMNLVYQQKWGANFYGVFHSKIMLLEFDDRLRVVIPSANLYELDWEMLSQVIWFQDFFPKSKEEVKEQQSSNDFREYLVRYMTDIYPKNVKTREVYRQTINLDKYDFSNAKARLIASVNGRFNGENLMRYGQNRFGALVKDHINSGDKILTYQTSSIGKLNQKFLQSLKTQFIGKSTKPISQTNDIQNNLRLIFPTEGHVQTSHLGQEQASSIILNADYWHNAPGFPRKSFHQQLARSSPLSNNLYHAKYLIVTDKLKPDEITDDTVMYFGSHNLSAGAWGNLEKDNTQISLANWEIGIVFPPMADSKEMKERIIKCLPIKWPPEKYKDTDYPFMFR